MVVGERRKTKGNLTREDGVQAENLPREDTTAGEGNHQKETNPRRGDTIIVERDTQQRTLTGLTTMAVVHLFTTDPISRRSYLMDQQGYRPSYPVDSQATITVVEDYQATTSTDSHTILLSFLEAFLHGAIKIHRPATRRGLMDTTLAVLI